MGINTLVRSKTFKNFMSKLYGWGAAVVIMGALFKINHYPGAEIMLIVGLTTESVIFFFSAFEPPHVEPDWSLVYPELAGMYTDSEEEMALKVSASGELDKMLEDAKIGPELIESLGLGLTKLSDTTSKLNDVSDASVATNEYVENIRTASKSASELSSNYNKTSEVLSTDATASTEYVENIKKASESANQLSASYVKASETLQADASANEEYVSSIQQATESAKALAEKYQVSAESLSKSAEAIDFSNVDADAYSEQLNKIAKNLAALNSVYELQLQGSQEQVESTGKMQEGIQQFLENLNQSIENTAKYKEEAATLAKNVAALNTVYGNMLTAMNVTKE